MVLSQAVELVLTGDMDASRPPVQSLSTATGDLLAEVWEHELVVAAGILRHWLFFT